ncbi:hypothetical protein [uncultured Selenomonas sp.]|uniref:hypothetical protein n=1 Tax=uncultured Selenomonas sp. TaxID=159275 RepID=UPI0028D42882|nr:hypothetical protein [uncultured Selenomonas sp.]
MKNGADYSAKSIGAEYHHYGSYDKMSRQEKNKVYNTIGLSPNLSMPTKDDANSTTTSAVAPGTIDIRDNPTQDISALNRDTSNALNELRRIFDKQKIEEQQELAKAFGEEAFRLAHNLPDDGSGRKVAVHAIIGGIMSQITGAGFTSGAIGAGVNEAIIGEIKKIKDPGTAQIVSAIVGAAAAKAVGGNAGSGASAAASGTKNNFLIVAQSVASQAPRIAKAVENLGEALRKAGYAIAISEGVQCIQKIDTNEVVAKLQQDGSWIFDKADSVLETALQNLRMPYFQPNSSDGTYFYFLPPIQVTPADQSPFTHFPNVLDFKYEPNTISLFDFKEQWPWQVFSDGNRFFAKGVEKEQADKVYPPADEHSSTNNSKDFKRTGKPNSSIDRVDEKGRIITRRWYDGNGRAKKDVDFTDHGNPKTHPEVPHEHTWKWDKDGNAHRK